MGLFDRFKKKPLAAQETVIHKRQVDKAREIACKIVNSIADSDFAEIVNTADTMKNWTAKLIQELIETYQSDNDVIFDYYGAACNFNPVYKDGSVYEQERFYAYDRGFGYEYDFTSNGDLNDLTLMLTFTYKGDDIEVSFDDLHVM